MIPCVCGDPKCTATQRIAELKEQSAVAEEAIKKVLTAHLALGLTTPPQHLLVLALAGSILETFQVGADAAAEAMQHAASVSDLLERSGVTDPTPAP